MQAEVEDEQGRHKLTPGELGSFFLLLVVAGNETTRTAISHGMLELTRRPDQRAAGRPTSTPSHRPRLRRSCGGRRRSSISAAPRSLTRSSAVNRSRPATKLSCSTTRQTATSACSTIRSASTWPAPRTSMPGSAPGGPHFCLGANLARREIRVMFEELLRRLPDLEISGEPELLQSNFIHGIKRMPCRWHTVRD